jgi:hypothetical protein
MSAMILLTANAMQNPQGDSSSLDKQLVDVGLQTLDKMIEETNSEFLRSFQTTCAELHQHSQRMRGQAIMKANRGHSFSHLPDTWSDSERPEHSDGF